MICGDSISGGTFWKVLYGSEEALLQTLAKNKNSPREYQQ